MPINPAANNQIAAGNGTAFNCNETSSKKPSDDTPPLRVAVSRISIERVPFGSRRESEKKFQSNNSVFTNAGRAYDTLTKQMTSSTFFVFVVLL